MKTDVKCSFHTKFTTEIKLHKIVSNTSFESCMFQDFMKKMLNKAEWLFKLETPDHLAPDH